MPEYNPLGNKIATQIDAENTKISTLNQIKLLLEICSNSADSTIKSNWTSVIGNSVQYTYDGSNNVITAEYYTGATLVFTQTFTYDGSNNCTSITTT